MGSFSLSAKYVLIVSLTTLVVSGYSSITSPVRVLAADACENNCVNDQEDDTNYRTCLSEKRACLESRLQEIKTQKATLSNTLSLLSGRVAVQELQIKQTEAELNRLEREITQLADRISGLNLSLDRLSTILVERIQSHYKASRVSRLISTLAGDSLSEALSRSAYIEETGRQTASAMERAEAQRIIYDEQKVLKEQKQLDVEKKQKQLENERAELARQRQEQQNLLKVTNNNEARYQQLLAEAQAQINSFKRFVSVSGGTIIGPDGLGKGYDGSYFSQRDSRWATTAIGNSSENIYNVGCLITSIAMVLKSKGVDTTPGAIGTNSSYFFANTAYMLSRSGMSLPGGKSGRKIPTSEINKELESGNPVIVGVRAGPYGTHFVVLKKKDGDNWQMFDPWYGPDLQFSSHYSAGSIFSAEIIQ